MKTKNVKCEVVKAAWPLGAVPSALVLAGMLLAGCGGGGGGSSASASRSLSGAVIDGYIEGAEVCLDLNNNQVCDTGEPKAITGKDGGYKLDTTGLSADQIKAAHLLTTVPTTAKDADDGGKTLAEAGKSAFNLLAPAASYVSASGTEITGAVISPLTTLVSHDMITSNTPLATAQGYVRARLNLAEGTDLTQDFVAKKDTQLGAKAQMLAAAIGEVKAQTLADTATKPTDKQALFAALQYLQTQVADLQKAVDAAKTSNSSAKPVDLVKTAIATDAAKPVVADLVAEAKKSTDSSAVSSIVALLEQGFYGAQHVLENCGLNCTPSYWKVKGSGGTITLDNDYDYDALSKAWKKISSNGDWVLTSTGWKRENVCDTGQSSTYSAGSDGVTTIVFCSGSTERVSARVVEAAGKTLAALGLNPPTAYAATVMPAGSQLYWLEFANTQDKYYLYTDGNPTGYATLSAFIQNHTASNPRCWSGLCFSFDTGGTTSGGNLTLWSPVGTATSSAKKIGSATYTRRTIGTQEVLIINAPAPENDKGALIMFAAKGDMVYGGSYRSAEVRQSREPKFNKTMLNAILAAGQLPNVLD